MNNLPGLSALRPTRNRTTFVVVAGAAILVSLLLSGVLTGASPDIEDTDGFMRMSRAADLREGVSGWWDGDAHRSNAPFGHSMHWTRPLDVAVVGLSYTFDPFFEADLALEVAGLVVGPLLFVALAVAVSWAAAPLLGTTGGVVAGLALVLQPALQSYGGVGRADHHMLIVISAALLVGWTIRMVLRPSGTTAARWAGVTCAFGVWVSTEFLLAVALFLLVGVFGWVRSERPSAQLMRVASVAWAGGTTVALLIERAPDMFPSRDLDRISFIHLVVAALAVVFWAAAERAPGALPRLLAAVAAAAITGGVLVAMFPGFVAGPFGDVPSELWEAWLSRVSELQPLWPFGTNPVRTAFLTSAPLVGLGLALAAARSGRSPAKAIWTALGAALAVTLALGFFQARFVAFAQILAPLPWAWLAVRLIDRIGDAVGPGARLRRLTALLTGSAGFLVPVLIAVLVVPSASSRGQAASCEIEGLIEIIRSGPESPVVLTHVDWGPEILYRTDGAVVAAPYHRNVDGILDARRFLGSSEEAALSIATDRSVDLVAVCPSRDADYLGPDRQPDDLLAQIGAGVAPEWLQLVFSEGELAVYEVVGVPTASDSAREVDL